MSKNKESGKFHLPPNWAHSLCCFIALSFVFMNNWLMNTFTFPLYDTLFEWTREISSGMQGLTLIIIALLATYRPHLLPSKLYSLGSLLCLCLGTVLTLVGISSGRIGALIIGASLLSIGRGIIILVVGISFLALSLRNVGICVAGACLFSYLIRDLFLSFDLVQAGVFLYYCAPFISLLVALPLAFAYFKETSEKEAPADIRLSEPSSFLPFGHQLFLSLLLFRVTHGYALTFGEEDRIPFFTTVAIIPLLGVFIWALARKRHIDSDGLFQLSFLLVIAGFLLLPLANTETFPFVNALLNSGVGCFEVLIWFVLLALGKRNPTGALPILAWGSAMTSIGVIFGANLGRFANQYYGDNHLMLALIAALIVFLAVLYVVVGLKRFSFEETITDLQPLRKVVVTFDSGIFEQRITEIGRDHGLTAREIEVFLLLARGRNGRFIQQELTVSYNTVKAHIRHIYAKLGIHAHQELIDYVELSLGEE